MAIAAASKSATRSGDCRLKRRRRRAWWPTTKPLLRSFSVDRRRTAADSAAVCIADRRQCGGYRTSRTRHAAAAKMVETLLIFLCILGPVLCRAFFRWSRSNIGIIASRSSKPSPEEDQEDYCDWNGWKCVRHGGVRLAPSWASAMLACPEGHLSVRKCA